MICLVEMARELARKDYREFAYDPDIFADAAQSDLSGHFAG